jgi:hypothetical protein
MAATENNENILPGHHPNSRAALTEHGPPKGESRNPAGRPKGSRNIRTILDEMLYRYVDVEALKQTWPGLILVANSSERSPSVTTACSAVPGAQWDFAWGRYSHQPLVWPCRSEIAHKA